jgi:hypothetical protein
MSMPPPPPPSDQPPLGWGGASTPPPSAPQPMPYAPGPGYGAPPPSPYGAMPGYAPYGQQPAPQKMSGMAIAGLVLGLVGMLPCFWLWFQLPGLLGLVFSLIGLKATRGGARKGRGLAIGGLVVSIVGLLIAVGFTAFVYTSDDCVTNGLEVNCNFGDV